MADNQSTGQIEPPVLSPETLTAVDVLLRLVGADTQPALPAGPVAAVQRVIDGFDRVGMAGRQQNGGEYPRLLAEIHGDNDPTRDPSFLGEAPVREEDGTCSFCEDCWEEHYDTDAEVYLDGLTWHRRDCHDRTGGVDGFYSNELPAVTR